MTSEQIENLRAFKFVLILQLKISPDLYWETKFTSLRGLISRRKCTLGVKAEPTEKKGVSHFERKLHLPRVIILILISCNVMKFEQNEFLKY